MRSEYKELTYKESLEKFSLKENYTEEELKRNYRELMRKKHPDLYINKSKEEQAKAEYEAKQINEAYDKLLKKLRGEYVSFPNDTTSNNTKNHTNGKNILEYQIKIIRKMGSYTKDIEKLSDKLSNIKDKIDDLLAIETYIINLLCITKKDIDNNYKKFNNKVLEINKLIKEALFKSNFVDESELNLNINYDKPIKKFYDEMQAIAEKYGKKNKFKKQLEKEESSYEYYAYYNDVKDIINRLKEKSLKKAENRQFKNLDDLIVEFNTSILEEFDKCARIMTLINEQIDNENLSDKKLQKLKDIINNYSKYEFTKSMEIINKSNEEIENDITIYVKESPFVFGSDFTLETQNDVYIMIENSAFNIGMGAMLNNYITLKEFTDHSIYIGRVGILNSRFAGSTKVELLCRNNNSVLVRNKEGKITLDYIGKYMITDERIELRTYEELESEILNMFKQGMEKKEQEESDSVRLI